MPKENVYDTNTTQSVEVTWGRDQAHVQVGARFAGQPFRFLHEPDQEPAAGDPVPPPGEPLVFESLHVTLTRRGQVNELIRVLKRARDQAFGRDE